MKNLFLLALTLGLLSCAKTQVKKQGNQSWPENMQELAETLTDLLPYAFDKEKFEDPKNRKKVRQKIKEFQEASHVIPKKKATQIFGKDPLVSLSIDNLKREVGSAIESFDRGNYRYSRHLVQHTLNYCFACHTRSHFGPKYDYWNLDSLAKANVPPIQKSRIMVATRQFENAKKVLKTHLVTGNEEFANPYFQEQAIKQYLAIVVRAEDSPEEGYKFVNEYSEKLRLPVYLAKNVESWEASFMSWMSENKKKRRGSIKKAKRLINRSDFLHTDHDGDSKYVDYLRASAILHDELARNLKKKSRAEAYYYLGVIYNLLSDSGFWELPENYFEACVRELPKSKMAKKCYRSFEQNIVVGYSGSAGTFIPAEERKRMAELKTISGYK